MLPFRPPTPPTRHRTALVVGGVVVAVALIAGTVAAVATRGSGDDPTTTSTTSSEPAESDPTTESSEPTPTEPTAPTYSPTLPSPTPTSTGPTPTYPNVPPATGIKLQVGRAEMRAPAGWGRVTQTDIPNGVGSRDYSDYEGYYSSVFLERTEPVFPLESLSLLEIVAMAAVEALADKNADIQLVKKEELPSGWLDGAQAARVRGVYKNTDTGLFFAEESWFAQKGKYLHRLTFQHSRADSLDQRRADIDPVVVSFRWR
jgi:type IV secretory pathway VirB10-like protein